LYNEQKTGLKLKSVALLLDKRHIVVQWVRDGLLRRSCYLP
jgi:hypothetical protein